MAKEQKAKGKVTEPTLLRKTPPTVSGREKEALEQEKVLALMKTLRENGIAECTSTLLRDKLGLDKETGRDTIRRIMRKLEKDGKVKITVKAEGKRKQYIYELVK